jgi:hypothetical protein
MTGKFMRASIIILLVFWSANANAEGVGKNKYEAPSLCAARDKIFFSCKTKKLKTISLCGQKNEGSVRRLYYRYGKPDKIELEYPKGTVSNKDSLTLFYYNHYTRWLVDYYTITFRNYGYVYVLQDLRSMEEKNDPHITQNIAVYVHPKYDEATDIPCASDVISDLYPLVNVIPCDKENALGCEK